mmetsp:Transcript_108697/g.335745  ORF Transcript_108697/g.335745 Transcript_108697/m.335745 type:complete len:255 (+) Transcript_108697:165-929(+)
MGSRASRRRAVRRLPGGGAECARRARARARRAPGARGHQPPPSVTTISRRGFFFSSSRFISAGWPRTSLTCTMLLPTCSMWIASGASLCSFTAPAEIFTICRHVPASAMSRPSSRPSLRSSSRANSRPEGSPSSSALPAPSTTAERSISSARWSSSCPPSAPDSSLRSRSSSLARISFLSASLEPPTATARRPALMALTSAALRMSSLTSCTVSSTRRSMDWSRATSARTRRNSCWRQETIMVSFVSISCCALA